jgi:hypothetical protein
LPKDDSDCDGNTIEADSLIVQHDGSFSEKGFVMYLLPSPTLAESAATRPACDASQQCVLYVGADQNDFTQPKVFSAPFTVQPSPGGSGSSGTSQGSGSSGGTGATGTGSSSGQSTQPNPATSPAAGSSTAGAATAATTQNSSVPGSQTGTLAYTGPPSLAWLLGFGGGFLLAGSVGRRFLRESS